MLLNRGVRLQVLQLGNTDLTSPTGQMIMRILAAMAEFERHLIIERTQAGQARARAAGKHMGRPPKTTEKQRAEIRKQLGSGATVSAVARQYGISRATVIAIRAQQ